MKKQKDELNRRQLIKHGLVTTGAAVGLSMAPRPLKAMFGNGSPEPIPPIQDSRIKELVQRGLDAARGAGAAYADVRMTYTRLRSYMASTKNPTEDERLHAGVRVLINGYWGFASSPVWSPEELARLGVEAARQAKANALGKSRDVLFSATTVVRDGHWSSPIRIDPFLLHPDEIGDYLLKTTTELRSVLGRFDRFGDTHNDQCGAGFTTTVQEKAFGSTDGSYCTQRRYRSSGGAKAENALGLYGMYGLTPAALGWEYFLDTPVVERVKQSIEAHREMARLPVKPIEVGRYNTVFDADSVANLIGPTIGAASEIDRALGFEANAGGTSYIMDPDTMLHTETVGAKMLTVGANRNEPGGVATTKWDDEGVAPESFTIVKNGILTDFHTSREGSGWLKDAYGKTGQPLRSNGCVFAETGVDIPTIRVANLTVQPSETSASYDDLEKDLDKGMSIVNMVAQIDFQLLNGYASMLRCFEIKGGKRVARISGGGLMFRTPELWKGILAMGGAKSAERFGIKDSKGEPEQTSYYSVTAVPMIIKDLTYVDRARR